MKYFKKISVVLVAVVMTLMVMPIEGKAASTMRYIGDVNGDGSINSADQMAMLRYINGSETLDYLSLLASDVNGDNAINLDDLELLMEYVSGDIDEFSAGNYIIISNTSNGRLFGDVNGDGEITMSDVILIQRYIGGMASFDYLDLLAADVNGDNQVTNEDVTMLQRYIASLITSFPAGKSIVIG